MTWFEKQKKRPQAQTKAEQNEQEKDKEARANAKKQLLPVEWVLGVNIWNVDYHPSTLVLQGKGRNDTLITCWFQEESVELEMVAVGSVWDKLQDSCMYWVKTGECDVCESVDHAHQAMIARALYCLGTGHPDVLAQFDSTFSHHEQLELRLSMPREFWPKAWLDEEQV